ncbi:MAG TPA: hypothetical protein VF219_08435 [Vicinamibacterales bacterium]
MATKRTGKGPIRANVWKCEDLKALIKKQIDAHVKDVDVARRLEKALSGEIAYGDGGGGNVGVA